MRLISDDLSAALSEPIDLPSEDDVARVIGRLDAERYTMVTFDAGMPRHLVVGGGNGKYVVYLTQDNEMFFTLTKAGPDGLPPVWLCVGGQEGDFPANQVVDNEMAMAAALHYLKTSDKHPGLLWSES